MPNPNQTIDIPFGDLRLGGEPAPAGPATTTGAGAPAKLADGLGVTTGKPLLTSQTVAADSLVRDPGDRPAWLPAKFKDAAAMAAAYTALEQKMGGKPAVPAAEPAATVPAPIVPPKPADGTPPAVEAPAANPFDAAAAEYAQTQTLKPETYAALAKVGAPKELVDSYIAAQTARSESFEDYAVLSFGGKDNYAAAIQSASASFTPAEIDAFNVMIQSPSWAQRKMALSVLAAKTGYSGAPPSQMGNGPRNLGGPTVSPYASEADMLEDQQNPLYAKSAQFRAKVEARVRASM